MPHSVSGRKITTSSMRRSVGGGESDDRLRQQLAFVLEADGLKGVERRSFLADGSRRENSAEHSWHLVLMAVVLAEHARGPVDIGRVLTMLIFHDLVEIDAGDTFVYDTAGRDAKAEHEAVAARRIYGLLPEDQHATLLALWNEYGAQEAADAQFAAALDRLEPLLLNHASGGATWSEASITADRVREVNRRIENGSPALWDAARSLIDDAVARGILADTVNPDLAVS